MNLETKPLIYNIYIYILKKKKKPNEATNPNLYFQQLNKTNSKSKYLTIMKGHLHLLLDIQIKGYLVEKFE